MYFIDTVYASTEAENTSETNSDVGVAASLGLNTQLFVFQLINFAIVAAILWFLILKPLTKTLAARKKIIDESLDNSKKIEENLQKSEQKFNEKMAEVKVEANRLIIQAVEDGEKLSVEVKTKAKKEIEALIEQAKVKIHNERQATMVGIKEEAANLVISALEKILKEKMDNKKDKELIEDALEGLKI